MIWISVNLAGTRIIWHVDLGGKKVEQGRLGERDRAENVWREGCGVAVCLGGGRRRRGHWGAKLFELFVGLEAMTAEVLGSESVVKVKLSVILSHDIISYSIGIRPSTNDEHIGLRWGNARRWRAGGKEKINYISSA